MLNWVEIRRLTCRPLQNIPLFYLQKLLGFFCCVFWVIVHFYYEVPPNQLCSIWLNLGREYIPILWWPRQLSALQLQKTRANRKGTSKSRKQQVLKMLTTQPNKIFLFAAARFFVWLCCEHLQCVLSNWWSRFLNLQVFFLYAARWSLSATVLYTS